jgi:hypothetical protein
MRAFRDHAQRRSVRSVIRRSQGLCIDRTLRARTQEESEFEQLLGSFLPAKRRARENRVELDKVCRGGFTLPLAGSPSVMARNRSRALAIPGALIT